MYGLARPLLFRMDAERAHALGLSMLETAYRTGMNPLLSRGTPAFPVKVMNMTFPNPVGLAAGCLLYTSSCSTTPAASSPSSSSTTSACR